MIKSETFKVRACVGQMSCVGYLANAPYPRSGGNYFWLECGLRILNFRAENFKEARERFLEDGLVTIRVWTWEEGRGDYQAAIVHDERIPESWYDNKLCFTGATLPPKEVAKEIYDLLGDPDYEYERFIDPELYYARRGGIYVPYADGSGAMVKHSSDESPQHLMDKLRTKRGGILAPVHTHEEDGNTFVVERLHPPLRRGAGDRYYRLWKNGQRLVGGQYQYDLESALETIEAEAERDLHSRINALNSRIAKLERSNRLANSMLEGGEFLPLGANDVWHEVKELVSMTQQGAAKLDIEAQGKRIRLMLLAMEKK